MHLVSHNKCRKRGVFYTPLLQYLQLIDSKVYAFRVRLFITACGEGECFLPGKPFFQVHNLTFQFCGYLLNLFFRVIV